jgi:hypothetical protein
MWKARYLLTLFLATAPLSFANPPAPLEIQSPHPICASVLEDKYWKTRMHEEYRGEDQGKWVENGSNLGWWHVTYITDPSIREKYLIRFSGGKAYDYKGRPLAETAVMIFVMDAAGRIYASPTSLVGRIHHSTFLAGRGVSAAGEFVFLDGRLFGRNRRSGHYSPPLWADQQLARELIDGGAISPDSLLNEDPGWDVFVGTDGRTYTRDEIMRIIRNHERRAG